MNSKSDVNRRVLVIQAKKKRHKPNKKKAKGQVDEWGGEGNTGTSQGADRASPVETDPSATAITTPASTVSTSNTFNHHAEPSHSSSNETIEDFDKMYTSEEEEQESREDYCKGEHF